MEDDGTEVSRSLESKDCDNTVVVFNVENNGKGDNIAVAFNVENDGNKGEYERDSNKVVSSKIGEQVKDFAGGVVSCGSTGPDYLLTEVDGGQSQRSRETHSGPKGIKSGGNVVGIDGPDGWIDCNIVSSGGLISINDVSKGHLDKCPMLDSNTRALVRKSTAMGKVIYR